MIIGIPKEIKNNEFRVSVVPNGVKLLTGAGHKVLIQKGAGLGSGIYDEEYVRNGGVLLETGKEVYDHAELIVKVKEPLPEEYGLLKEEQVLFSYLHLAPAPDLTQALLERKCIALAYETVRTADGVLPLLTPMSEVAGRVSVQAGVHYLQKNNGGRGILLSGVPGVSRGKVTIVGGGVVGANAAKIAIGLGAKVYIVDVSQKRLAYLDDIFGNSITTIMSTPEIVFELLVRSDLVIGAVLLPGALAPVLVNRETIAKMLPGSVVVDVAIDQGGCFETSRVTTHDDPVYIVDDVLHYCVANIPSLVSRTSTYALSNVTFPYVLNIANKGLETAIKEDASLAQGVNLWKGLITYPAVAESMKCECEGLFNILH
jgi:alanine dehydrogenase